MPFAEKMVRFNRTTFKRWPVTGLPAYSLTSSNRQARPRAQPADLKGFLFSGRNCQLACKPGSVWPSPLAGRERGGHSSWAHVAMRLTQPTRTVSRKQPSRVSPRTAPIRFCSRWGLPCRSCCQSRGGLLPHPFTLAPNPTKPNRGGLLSVALSLGSPPPAINRHRVSMEPGLSSPAAFRRLRVRPPSQLARRIKGFTPENANEKADLCGRSKRNHLHFDLAAIGS